MVSKRKWVTDLIAKGKQNEVRWKWRSPSKNVSQWGDSVSWRVGQEAELRELVGLNARLAPANL
jgi:hypothetical protein